MTTGIEAPVRRQVLESGDVAALAAWAAEIESWPAGSHIWGHYAEATAHGPAICRTENVSACHAGVASLSTGVLRDLAAGLLGEPATDFKDKLNYKQPGGAGFLPHQDAVAYPGVARVVSVLVAIDECSRTSGCLWIASGVDEVLPVDERGVVRDDVCRDAANGSAPSSRRATRCASTGSRRTTATRIRVTRPGASS